MIKLVASLIVAALFVVFCVGCTPHDAVVRITCFANDTHGAPICLAQPMSAAEIAAAIPPPSKPAATEAPK